MEYSSIPDILKIHYKTQTRVLKIIFKVKYQYSDVPRTYPMQSVLSMSRA